MKINSPRVRVVVYVRGDDLDPSDVSVATGIQPSRSQKRGDLRCTSTGAEIRAQIGLWAIGATIFDESVGSQLDEILGKFARFPTSLHDVKGVQEAYIDVFVGAEVNTQSQPTFVLELSAAQLAAMCHLGLQYRVTFSAVLDETMAG